MEIDAAFAAPGRFFKGNLHTHSTRSDGARIQRSCVHSTVTPDTIFWP